MSDQREVRLAAPVGLEAGRGDPKRLSGFALTDQITPDRAACPMGSSDIAKGPGRAPRGNRLIQPETLPLVAVATRSMAERNAVSMIDLSG